MTRLPLPALTAFLALAGCGISGRETRCGIAALAGPTMLLEEFTKPGKTLAHVPEPMPETIPVRMVAGPAQRALVGKADSLWIIGVDGPLPTKPQAGFGVLLADPKLGPRGVLLFEGRPIPGAPKLGSVNIGSLNIPLIGLRVSVAAFQDPNCPLFPDSLRRSPT